MLKHIQQATQKFFAKKVPCWMCGIRTPFLWPESFYPCPIAGFVSGTGCPECIEKRAVTVSQVKGRLDYFAGMDTEIDTMENFKRYFITMHDMAGTKHGYPMHVVTAPGHYIRLDEWLSDNRACLDDVIATSRQARLSDSSNVQS